MCTGIYIRGYLATIHLLLARSFLIQNGSALRDAVHMVSDADFSRNMVPRGRLTRALVRSWFDDIMNVWQLRE